MIIRHKYLIFLVFQFTCVLIGNSQLSYQDLLRETNEQERVEKASRISYMFGVNDLDSLFILSNYIIQNSTVENKLLHSIGRRALGSYYVKSGFQAQGRDLLLESAIQFKKLEEISLYSEALNEVGNSYFLSGEGKLAIAYYLLSMKVGEQAQDRTSHYNGMLGLAKTYCSIGDTTLGLEFANKFVSLAKQGRKYEALADSYAFLGMIYFALNKQKKATWNYNQSLYYSKMSGSRVHLAHSFNNRAILDYQSNQLDSSRYYFDKSLGLRKDIGNTKSIIESYFNLANFFIGTSAFDKAMVYLDSSRVLSKRFGYLQDEIDALIMLHEFGNRNVLVQQVDSLKEKLNSQNKISSKMRQGSLITLKNSRNKKQYVSPRNRGDYAPWIIISLVLPLVVLLVIFVQKRLV